jgi:hypothetical protein
VEFAKTKPKFLTPDGTSPAKMGGNKFTRFAAKLKAKPGIWAKYPGDYTHTVSNVYNMAYMINSNRRSTLPARYFEANVDEDLVLWVRAKPPSK